MGLFRRKADGTIDLVRPTEADIEMVRRVRAMSDGRITFGAPTRCPECASYGHVDSVDQINRCCDNMCPACRSTWRIYNQAIDETAEAVRRTGPVGGGILIEGLAKSA